MRNLNLESSANSCTGNSLIETLVALLILSVGMLLVTRMLTQSIAVVNNALERQRAAFTVNNLHEFLYGMPRELLQALPVASNYACNGEHVCTPEQLLADGLYHWRTLLNRQLPNATGTVAHDNLDGQAVMRISVAWGTPDEQPLQQTSYLAVPPSTDMP